MGRTGDSIKDSIKKCVEVFALLIQVFGGNTIPADCIEQRKFKLLLGGIQID